MQNNDTKFPGVNAGLQIYWNIIQLDTESIFEAVVSKNYIL